MRPHSAKLRRHKDDPVPLRPFKRDLQRLLRTHSHEGFQLVGQREPKYEGLAQEFLTHMRRAVQLRTVLRREAINGALAPD